MIRINLLPVRAAKKKESIRLQLTVAGLVTFLVFALTIAYYIKLTIDVSQRRDDIAKNEAELKELDIKIGELNKLQDQKRTVLSKLEVVDRLEAGRTGPMVLFDRISDAMPEKLWLKSMKDDNKVITLDGSAGGDEAIPDFMRALERAPEFKRVDLVIVKKSTLKVPIAEDFKDFTIKVEKR